MESACASCSPGDALILGAPRAALAALAGAALLAAEQRADTDARVGAALARVAFGAAAYYAWSAVPCYNKSDELPGFN
jgi:hypothetical protein